MFDIFQFVIQMSRFWLEIGIIQYLVIEIAEIWYFPSILAILANFWLKWLTLKVKMQSAVGTISIYGGNFFILVKIRNRTPPDDVALARRATFLQL